MPQGQIRKGFFFYFGLFVLLLIAIFLICLVVMMFNPGKTVLWMQYFTGNNHYTVTKTTDESKTQIDWANVTQLEINCTYANVTVQRNKEFSEDGIHIFNYAKGFSGASNAVHFEYNVYFEGNTLKVDVVEPNGFIFFSKDIRIVLNAHTDRQLNFDRMKLTINSKDGQVDIGGTTAKGAENVKLSSLSVNTGKGDIYISERFDTSTLTALSLISDEGKIQSTKDISYGNSSTGKGFAVNCDTTLKTNKGLISLDAVNAAGHDIDLGCKKGNVAIDFIKADTINVACVQGNYRFKTIDGNLSYTNSEDSIIAPNIIVDYISGDFSLTTTGNVDAEPDVTIKEIKGNIMVIADKGKIDVNKAHGAISVDSANQLNVDIVVAEDREASKNIVINNVSGSVKLGFLGAVAESVRIVTEKGKVDINVTSLANFVADAFVNDGNNTTRLSNDKISVSLGLAEGETKNPLTVRGTSSVSGTMTITTNSNVSYNLVGKTA